MPQFNDPRKEYTLSVMRAVSKMHITAMKIATFRRKMIVISRCVLRLDISRARNNLSRTLILVHPWTDRQTDKQTDRQWLSMIAEYFNVIGASQSTHLCGEGKC